MALSRRKLFVVTALLLVIAGSRWIRVASFRMDTDEIWAIWQTFGTPTQIVQWTSPTETPVYFLALGAWKDLAGLHPDILRYLSLLIALLGAALMYRAGRRAGGSGILAMLAYSALAVMTFINLYTRSYVLAYTALPLALWMLHRYFDRPTVGRGLLLVLALVLLYAATVTVALAAVLLGVYALLVYGRRAWRGIFPAGLALVVVLPDLLANKLQMVGLHAGAEREIKLDPLPGAAIDFFNYFTSATWVWYGLVLVAVGMLIYAAVQAQRKWDLQKSSLQLGAWFWLVWVLGVPLLLYVLESRLGFYTLKRYGWWYGFGLAPLIGVGLVRLPKVGQWLAAGVLLIVLFVPFSMQPYGYIVTDLGENMRWLRDEMAGQDVVIIDPSIECNYPEEWDYYTRVYFPNGLNIVDQPGTMQRVWLASAHNDATRAADAELMAGRIPGRFVGPPGCLFQLYEAPPDAEGVLFENGMRFHGFEILRGDRPLTGALALHEGEKVTVRLWWSTDVQLPLDYSVGLYLQRGADVRGQSDSAPQLLNGPPETSRWQPGQLYFEERTLQLDYPITPGRLGLLLGVYWYGDGERIKAPGVNDNGQLFLKQFAVIAW